MKNLITSQNLTFTNQKCNCGLNKNVITKKDSSIKLKNKEQSKKKYTQKLKTHSKKHTLKY